MRFNLNLKTKGFRGVIAILSLVALGTIAAAQEPAAKTTPSGPVERKSEQGEGLWRNFQFVVEAGAQIRNVDGDRPSKFEQWKSVREGVLFRRFAVRSNPAGERAYFYLAGRNPSERDQLYLLEGGCYGRFRTSATWSAQPFVYSRGATSLLTTSAPGVYAVPDAIQQNLQALDPPFTNATTTPNPALTNATAYDFPEAKARLHELSFDTNYQLRPNVAVGFRYLYEPFRLDDWQLNTVNAYPVDQLAPETDGRRFLLLDSRYTDHNAHVFSFYIRFGK